jgi:GDPmannose 4,6-dehydratase
LDATSKKSTNPKIPNSKSKIMKRVLILGIGGQDGSYLADNLLSRGGYEVHGMVRRSSTGNLRNIAHLEGKVTLHRGDLSDPLSIHRILESVQPHYIYNLADQDNIGWSYMHVGYNLDVTAGAVGRLLESVRMLKAQDSWGDMRIFQACSATMYGPREELITEDTPLNPQSPYACAKAAAYHLCRMYRQRYGMFVSCGILFNHDSPRRSPDYLPQQIARQAVEVLRGKRERIELRGPNTRVDIGWAPEYVEAMRLICEAEKPDDFVAGTGWGCRIDSLCRVALGDVDCSRVTFEKDSETAPANQSTSSPEKIERVLGWQSTIDGGDVIERLVAHFKEQP